MPDHTMIVKDREKIIKSSAYKIEWSFMPFGKTNGSDRMLNQKAKSLGYRLNSRGRKMQPWRTPLALRIEKIEFFF